MNMQPIPGMSLVPKRKASHQNMTLTEIKHLAQRVADGRSRNHKELADALAEIEALVHEVRQAIAKAKRRQAPTVVSNDWVFPH
jgi:hypothetical protein